MPSNADIVRQAFDAFNRGDVEGQLALLAEDVVIVEAPEYPGAATRHGHAGVRETLASWAQAWGEQSVDLEEVVELDAEQVLARGRQHARGSSGGVGIEAPICALYRVRDGRIASMRFFLDADQARAAAG